MTWGRSAEIPAHFECQYSRSHTRSKVCFISEDFKSMQQSFDRRHKWYLWTMDKLLLSIIALAAVWQLLKNADKVLYTAIVRHMTRIKRNCCFTSRNKKVEKREEILHRTTFCKQPQDASVDASSCSLHPHFSISSSTQFGKTLTSQNICDSTPCANESTAHVPQKQLVLRKGCVYLGN